MSDDEELVEINHEIAAHLAEFEATLRPIWRTSLTDAWTRIETTPGLDDGKKRTLFDRHKAAMDAELARQLGEMRQRSDWGRIVHEVIYG